ncbi:hypothetical protein [Phreatobacter sp.]|uniref:RraA family protein n=1 Tax=Phreatobacter sp. TaxID=1966341 RepID=UPI0025D30C54|nr:hypothetical protein [Phreatobacter sp.]
MIKFVCTASVYDALNGQVTLLPGISSFSYHPFAAPIHYHRVEADTDAPNILDVIQQVPAPETKVLFLDAGGRDDVHLVSGKHLRLAKARKLAGIAVNGMVRGDTHEGLTGVMALFAIGRFVVPWEPADEQLTLTFFDEAAAHGAWLVGDADAVMVVEATQAKSIDLRQVRHPRSG